MRAPIPIRLFAGLLAAGFCFHLAAARSRAQDMNEPRSRLQKIKVEHMSAVELAVALGGTVLLVNDRPDRDSPALDGISSVAMMLPDDIEALTGLEADNTLLVKGTDDAIRDLRELCAIVDVPPSWVECQVEATVTLRGTGGQARPVTLRASGRTASGRPLHLTTRADSGPSSAGLPGSPANETYTLMLEGRATRDGQSVDLRGRWVIDMV